MCLAVPGRIVKITNEGSLTRAGVVDFSGVRRKVNLCFTPEAAPGEYVVVHVGFAIASVDEEEARIIRATFQKLDGTEDQGR